MTDNAPAGATPVVAGAMPAQNPPAPPAAPAASSPATGDPDALGDAGKRALDAMKAERNAAADRAKAAELELERLRTETQSDSEKAITQAKKDGAAEVTARWTAQVRRSEVKAALTGAGINASVLDLAVNAADFGALKVTDDGEVEGLDAAVKAFKASRGDLFRPASAGSPDAGTGGRPAAGAPFTRAQIADPKFYAAHRAEILAATNRGEIKD